MKLGYTLPGNHCPENISNTTVFAICRQSLGRFWHTYIDIMGLCAITGLKIFNKDAWELCGTSKFKPTIDAPIGNSNVALATLLVTCVISVTRIPSTMTSTASGKEPKRESCWPIQSERPDSWRDADGRRRLSVTRLLHAHDRPHLRKLGVN